MKRNQGQESNNLKKGCIDVIKSCAFNWVSIAKFLQRKSVICTYWTYLVLLLLSALFTSIIVCLAGCKLDSTLLEVNYQVPIRFTICLLNYKCVLVSNDLDATIIIIIIIIM